MYQLTVLWIGPQSHGDPVSKVLSLWDDANEYQCFISLWWSDPNILFRRLDRFFLCIYHYLCPQSVKVIIGRGCIFCFKSESDIYKMNRIRLRLYNISHDAAYRYIVLGYFVRHIATSHIGVFFLHTAINIISWRNSSEIKWNKNLELNW